MIRTFIAVDLSSEIRERIKDIHRQLADHNVRLVDPDLVHITIKFLGDILEEKVRPISDALSGMHCTPFDVDVEGIGTFPSMNYIRIIWVGVKSKTSQHGKISDFPSVKSKSAKGDFEGLHDAVEAALKPLGFPPDNRKFTAHATLARVKKMSKDQKMSLVDTIKRLSDAKLGEMEVNSIRFKKSTLTPNGPIYETLHEVRL